MQLGIVAVRFFKKHFEWNKILIIENTNQMSQVFFSCFFLSKVHFGFTEVIHAVGPIYWESEGPTGGLLPLRVGKLKLPTTDGRIRK